MKGEDLPAVLQTPSSEMRTDGEIALRQKREEYRPLVRTILGERGIDSEDMTNRVLLRVEELAVKIPQEKRETYGRLVEETYSFARSMSPVEANHHKGVGESCLWELGAENETERYAYSVLAIKEVSEKIGSEIRSGERTFGDAFSQERAYLWKACLILQIEGYRLRMALSFNNVEEADLESMQRIAGEAATRLSAVPLALLRTYIEEDQELANSPELKGKIMEELMRIGRPEGVDRREITTIGQLMETIERDGVSAYREFEGKPGILFKVLGNLWATNNEEFRFANAFAEVHKLELHMEEDFTALRTVTTILGFIPNPITLISQLATDAAFYIKDKLDEAKERREFEEIANASSVEIATKGVSAPIVAGVGPVISAFTRRVEPAAFTTGQGRGDMSSSLRDPHGHRAPMGEVGEAGSRVTNRVTTGRDTFEVAEDVIRLEDIGSVRAGRAAAQTAERTEAAVAAAKTGMSMRGKMLIAGILIAIVAVACIANADEGEKKPEPKPINRERTRTAARKFVEEEIRGGTSVERLRIYGAVSLEREEERRIFDEELNTVSRNQ